MPSAGHDLPVGTQLTEADPALQQELQGVAEEVFEAEKTSDQSEFKWLVKDHDGGKMARISVRVEPDGDNTGRFKYDLKREPNTFEDADIVDELPTPERKSGWDIKVNALSTQDLAWHTYRDADPNTKGIGRFIQCIVGTVGAPAGASIKAVANEIAFQLLYVGSDVIEDRLVEGADKMRYTGWHIRANVTSTSLSSNSARRATKISTIDLPWGPGGKREEVAVFVVPDSQGKSGRKYTPHQHYPGLYSVEPATQQELAAVKDAYKTYGYGTFSKSYANKNKGGQMNKKNTYPANYRFSYTDDQGRTFERFFKSDKKPLEASSNYLKAMTQFFTGTRDLSGTNLSDGQSQGTAVQGTVPRTDTPKPLVGSQTAPARLVRTARRTS